jgi:hypothetical protein
MKMQGAGYKTIKLTTENAEKRSFRYTKCDREKKKQNETGNKRVQRRAREVPSSYIQDMFIVLWG